MNIYIKRYGKKSLAISVLLVIISLFLIFKPYDSMTFVMRIFAAVLTLNGIIHCISYFSSSKEFKMYSFELVIGIICITVGIAIFINPDLINGLLPIIIGSWTIIQSIIKFQLAFNMKSFNAPNWAFLLIGSIMTFVIGIIILLNPFGTAIAITQLCGIFLFVSEVINIIESIFMLKSWVTYMWLFFVDIKL